VAQLRAHEQEFRARNVAIAAIGLGDQQYAQEFRRESNMTFPLLVDAQRKAYSAIDLKNASLLHMLKKENFVARQRAQAQGHRQHKLGKNPFQLGGTFIFGPGERDIYAHVSQTFGDNAPVADVLRSLN
jgi:hypothetical protein